MPPNKKARIMPNHDALSAEQFSQITIWITGVTSNRTEKMNSADRSIKTKQAHRRLFTCIISVSQVFCSLPRFSLSALACLISDEACSMYGINTLLMRSLEFQQRQLMCPRPFPGLGHSNISKLTAS